MIDTHIGGLTAAGALQDPDLLVVEQGGTARKSALSGLLAHIASKLGGAAALDVGKGPGTVAAGDDGRLSDARTPMPHTHLYGDIEGLPAAIAALTSLAPAAGQLAYYAGASSAALTQFTDFGRNLVGEPDAANARGTLGAVGGTGVTDIVVLSQSEYDALDSPGITTLYIISG